MHGSKGRCYHRIKCKLFFWGLVGQRNIHSGMCRSTLEAGAEIVWPKKGEEKTQENRNKEAVIQVRKTRACPETGAAARPLRAEKGSWKETLVMPSFAVSAAVSSAMSFLGFLQSHSALSHV